MNDLSSPSVLNSSEILRHFLRDLRTHAAVSVAEAGLADRLEATDPDAAVRHMQASVEADAELVLLIDGPRGRLCLSALDRILRSGVVA